VQGVVVSNRKDWVSAKARAAKANGGNDVWKQFRVKDLGLGPALDAFDAAVAKFEAFDKAFDENNPSGQQKAQWLKLVKAKDQSARKVSDIVTEYNIYLDDLKRRRAINDKTWNTLSSGLYDAKKLVASNPMDIEDLRRKIKRLS
jgi:hypothetical protein